MTSLPLLHMINDGRREHEEVASGCTTLAGHAAGTVHLHICATCGPRSTVLTSRTELKKEVLVKVFLQCALALVLSRG